MSEEQTQIAWPVGRSIPPDVPEVPFAQTAIEASKAKELTKGQLTPDLIGKIYEDFLINGLTVRQLAAKYQVSMVALADMARDNQWLERRRSVELEELERAETAYRDFLQTNKLPTAEEQLKLSRAIMAKLEKVIESVAVAAEDITGLSDAGKASSVLKRLAETLKAAGDVGARAAGLSDTALSDYAGVRNRGNQGGEGRIPFVVLGCSAEERRVAPL